MVKRLITIASLSLSCLIGGGCGGTPFGGHIHLITVQEQPLAGPRGPAKMVAARQWNFVKDTSGAAWVDGDTVLYLKSVAYQLDKFAEQHGFQNEWLGGESDASTWAFTDVIVCIDPLIVVRSSAPMVGPARFTVISSYLPTSFFGVDTGRIELGRGMLFGRTIPVGERLWWYTPDFGSGLEELVLVDDGDREVAWIPTWWGSVDVWRDEDCIRVEARPRSERHPGS